MSEIISVTDALRMIRSDFSSVETEWVSIEESLDRVIADDIFASIASPPFDNSSMDGFAVVSEDLKDASSSNPFELEVIGDIPAGKIPLEVLRRGQTIRISTGGVIPKGADAVIPVEDTNLGIFQTGSSFPKTILANRSIKKGDYIREKGQDIKHGELILGSNSKLRPQDIGALASQGNSRVLVYRKPKIGILSTGDELVEIDQELQSGKIYNSNYFTLSNLLKKYGCLSVDLSTTKDNENSITKKLNQAADLNLDLIISTGGVSMGAFDYLKKIIEKNGTLKLWRVNIRPGKPLVFGRYREVPYIGLPGNPVSSFIIFEVFVRPVIGKLSGLEKVDRISRNVFLKESITSDGRESYLRAIIKNENGNLVAELAGHQGSGNIFSLVKANGIIIVPTGIKFLPPNSELQAWIF